MFILLCRYIRVFAYPGDDVTLSSHLSPETSAVSMEVRWFRGTECIYMYNKGQVSVGKGYEGRASMSTRELRNGNVSLTLKSISPLDTGIYSCQVLTGHNKVEKSIHLYMSGMEPVSPDLTEPKLTEKDSADMEESVIILELKKLLQQREKELEDKTRELEATKEMLKTKSGLLLYKDTDLANMSTLIHQKEEHLKKVLSELEMYKRRLEQLEQKLQEKDALVQELQVVLRDKEKHLRERVEAQITGLKNTAQDTADTQESVRLIELKNQLQKKEKELEDKAKESESTTEELSRTTKLLRDRETDVRHLANERDEFMKNVTGEMEMCLRELETLGQKLQEKNAEVEELRVVLQEKERELEEEKKRGRVITENKTADVSHVAFGRTYQNPKEQLEEMENWIAKQREKRRMKEEEERTEALEKEFLDYVSAVKELITKKYEKILAWAKMMAVLQEKLAVVETDEERQALQVQLKKALEMQKQGEEQIEHLTEDIEEKRNAIEEKHKHEIEEIRDKYSTVSKIQAETNILNIVLPDIRSYFQNKAGAEGQTRTPEFSHAGGAEISVEKKMLETVVEEETWQPDDPNSEDGDTDDASDKMVNGVMVREREINKEVQEKVREAKTHVVTDAQ
ncbi:MAR-binding filament-like protein 1 isoform X2 [Tachysurus fulvidraco]|uniref:MAR-binding filament-like protein 1 isoform X2 n=1 Tax=Tachysurus fulvidraco TaxID=1234273 RepID=UPI001FEE981A|nr:MAR-binding filament-like protein 1 isoform X2 [Tachysurus fulvidraco]